MVTISFMDQQKFQCIVEYLWDTGEEVEYLQTNVVELMRQIGTRKLASRHHQWLATQTLTQPVFDRVPVDDDMKGEYIGALARAALSSLNLEESKVYISSRYNFMLNKATLLDQHIALTAQESLL